jgi:hypothetical protein
MDNLKSYPPYKNAVEVISRVTEEEGFGRLFTHDELRKFMDMKEPDNLPEYKKFTVRYMSAIESLKSELLVDHSIFLYSERGQGYRVLEPEEQITIGAAHHIKKAYRETSKAMKSLIYARQELLSDEAQQKRQRGMQRVAFLQAAYRKREIPQVRLDKPKEEVASCVM